MPLRINTSENTRTAPSADATRAKGADGPILSNMIPPTRANVVVPSDPKKKARPDRVPLMLDFIFLMKSTSTQMNYMTETTIMSTLSTYACQSCGLSIY